MTLQECYEALGGDYEEVINRLRSERLVQKFVLKFLDDGSFVLLTESMEQENYEEAFRAAHTLKGVSQNLSFTELYQVSSAMSDALRGGVTPEAPAIFEQVRDTYAKVCTAIQEFQGGLAV